MGFKTTPEPRRDDDPSVPDDGVLYRVLTEESWVVNESGTLRVASHAFKDTATFETSCFLNIDLDELRGHFPHKRVCSITVSLARQQGFRVSRAPEEFEGNPSHVVLCPPGNLRRKEADRLWARLSEAARVLP